MVRQFIMTTSYAVKMKTLPSLAVNKYRLKRPNWASISSKTALLDHTAPYFVSIFCCCFPTCFNFLSKNHQNNLQHAWWSNNVTCCSQLMSELCRRTCDPSPVCLTTRDNLTGTSRSSSDTTEVQSGQRSGVVLVLIYPNAVTPHFLVLLICLKVSHR
eukprot:SAG31_NODE_2368_length_5854_cov_19.043440_5_plen_158_part_00